jgi:hypothetical protein
VNAGNQLDRPLDVQIGDRGGEVGADLRLAKGHQDYGGVIPSDGPTAILAGKVGVLLFDAAKIVGPARQQHAVLDPLGLAELADPEQLAGKFLALRLV